MKTKVPLPPIRDVGISMNPGGRSCRIVLVTDRAPTTEEVAATRRAVRSSLTGWVEGVELELAPAGNDSADPACRALDFSDPIVRGVLASIICLTHRPRLHQHAERCLWHRRERESAQTADDLVENALLLLLSGSLKWRGSLGLMLRTLCATIRNLSLNPLRFERKLRSLTWRTPRQLRATYDPEHEAVLVLLRSDVEEALSHLPPRQRAAAEGCLMNGATGTEIASAEGISPSTLWTHMQRARGSLRVTLASYGPEGEQPRTRAGPAM